MKISFILLALLSGSLTAVEPHALPIIENGQPREYQPDDRDEPLYADATLPVPLTATEDFFKRLPPSARNSVGHQRWAQRFDTPEKFQRTLRDYYRLVTGIDREFGRIRDALAAGGLADNTVIIFTSDNGYFFGERQLADKFYLYEESIRAPLIIHDPRLPACPPRAEPISQPA